MSKRLVITEEERNEIRGKYNLMEQSTGKFNVGDKVLYTTERGEIQQMMADVRQKISGGKNPLINVYKLENNKYVKDNRQIGLSTGEKYVITSKTNDGYFARPETATNTFIFIDNELSKKFEKTN